MSSNAGHYDASLAAGIPKLTKQQLQEGYDADLLKEKPLVAPTNPPVPAAFNPNDPESATHHPQKDFGNAPKGRSWYKTKKGIVVAIVVLVIIIAAAVGGGVGGSKKKHTDNAANTNGSVGGSTSSTVPGDQGAGTATTPSQVTVTAVPGTTAAGAPSQVTVTAPPATPSTPGGSITLPTQPPATQGSGNGQGHVRRRWDAVL